VIGNTEKMVGATWQGLAADFYRENKALQGLTTSCSVHRDGQATLDDGFARAARLCSGPERLATHRCTSAQIP